MVLEQFGRRSPASVMNSTGWAQAQNFAQGASVGYRRFGGRTPLLPGLSLRANFAGHRAIPRERLFRRSSSLILLNAALAYLLGLTERTAHPDYCGMMLFGPRFPGPHFLLASSFDEPLRGGSSELSFED
jgi:hypothetical protein